MRLGPIALAVSLGLALVLLCSRAKHGAGCNGAEAFKQYNDSLPIENVIAMVTHECFQRFEYPDTACIRRYDQALVRVGDSLRTALGPRASSPEGAQAIVSVVYANWGIGFDDRDTLLENLLPTLVFDRKKGSCVGVSLIILSLARRIQCPIFGVALPSHFFCRFDNGVRRCNLEPNRGGMEHPDEYYRKSYLSSNEKAYSLRNLSAFSSVALLYYNIGTLCLKKDDAGAALDCFRESIRRLPDFPLSRGNCALAWAHCGNLDSAYVLFDSLFSEYPSMDRLSTNFGYICLQTKRVQKAIHVFSVGMALHPNDTQIMQGLASSYQAAGKPDSAQSVRRRLKNEK